MTGSTLYQCMRLPKIIKPEIATSCGTSVSECERMKCVFRNNGWLDGDKVNTQNMTEYLNQFAKNQPEWAPAVQTVKTTCLSARLLPQGVYVNCEPYDVMSCTLTGFVKNVPPAQWSTSAQCTYPRQFAAACPLCPKDCFAHAIPYGSCNACVLLPRAT